MKNVRYLRPGDVIVRGPAIGRVASAAYSPRGGGQVIVTFTNGTSHKFNSTTQVEVAAETAA